MHCKTCRVKSYATIFFAIINFCILCRTSRRRIWCCWCRFPHCWCRHYTDSLKIEKSLVSSSLSLREVEDEWRDEITPRAPSIVSLPAPTQKAINSTKPGLYRAQFYRNYTCNGYCAKNFHPLLTDFFSLAPRYQVW